MAGIGHLDADWRTQLSDGFPIFSYLIAVAYRINGPLIVFTTFFALLFAYFFSLLSISRTLFAPLTKFSNLAAVAFVLLIVHSAFFVRFTLDVMEHEFRTGLTWGLAGFYMINGFLEMSTFGVLLLLSIERQIRRHPYQAAVWAAVACWFHPVFLVPAALLTLVYGWDNWKRANSDLSVIGPATLTLALVIPQVAYVLLFFGSTSPDIAAQAASILADIRYPHHVHLQNWLFSGNSLQPHALTQILVMGLAYAVIRNRLIRGIILVLSAYIVLSIAYYALTGDSRFGVSIPWRPSVILVPLATTLLVAAVFSAGPTVRTIAQAATLLLAAVCLPFLAAGFRVPQLETGQSPLVRHVFETARSDDLYLIPPTLNWHLFRAQAAAPILVDWKNHPLKDVEVVEWYQRILDIRPAYDDQRLSSCEVVDRLIAKYGITKVITTDGYVSCANLELEFDQGPNKLLAVVPRPQ